MLKQKHSPSPALEVQHQVDLEPERPVRFLGHVDQDKREDALLIAGELEQKLALIDNQDKGRFDALTGLKTRLSLEEDLPRITANAKRFDRTYVIAEIDSDGMKLVNDKAGHKVGDELVQATAEAISKATRSSDTVYRVGGDEYIVILEKSKDDELEEIAKSMKERLGLELTNSVASRSALKSAQEEHDITIGMSVGMEAWDPRSQEFEDAFNVADQRMYEDKRGKQRGLSSKGLDVVKKFIANKLRSHDSNRHDHRTAA